MTPGRATRPLDYAPKPQRRPFVLAALSLCASWGAIFWIGWVIAHGRPDRELATSLRGIFLGTLGLLVLALASLLMAPRRGLPFHFARYAFLFAGMAVVTEFILIIAGA